MGAKESRNGGGRKSAKKSRISPLFQLSLAPTNFPWASEDEVQVSIVFYQEHGVGVVNASPISMGLLSNRGPPSWHPAEESVRNKCKQAVDYCQVNLL